VSNANFELMNDAYRLKVTKEERKITVRLQDMATDFVLAEGPYVYRASRAFEDGSKVARRLKDITVKKGTESIEIGGELGGVELKHVIKLPENHPVMEEQIFLGNPTGAVIELEDFATGFQRRIADDIGRILPEAGSDRLQAVPLLHRASDPADYDWDFAMADLIERPGREQRFGNWPPGNWRFGYLPAMHYASEGWAWIHGEHAIGIFKFNQEGMEFSVLAVEVYEDGLYLRFGGAAMVAGDPSALRHIQPGQTIPMGLTRYQTVKGPHRQACYAFRAFLDEKGCRFPKGYNPPVHWNELYDNPEWHVVIPSRPEEPQRTRQVTYTRELMEEEARKARAYGCEALYLDPGWDTEFGTFLWGEDWLGPRKDFINLMRDKYGLKVSLHCPLATWMSMYARGVSSWPKEAFQAGPEGNISEGCICLGSKQYLEEAARRLLANCADGATFLMFDGNWWNGGCWNSDHGHPVPYTMEDHIRANIELARRIHEKYPHVLIEMHDMITGGAPQRYTPVYYKYGLPASYDENWGFELMWSTMEDIISGRARSLYYYNLGCNVPIYLHVDLRDDNEHCLVLWWYASTCRHLGIGGTHGNPAIAEAQKLAMKEYRRLERFYKRGEFLGVKEEMHIHLLKEEGAFVVNLFNLSDQTRIIEGCIGFGEMGLRRDKYYIMPKGGSVDVETGTFSISRRMPPWSAQLAEVRSI